MHAPATTLTPLHCDGLALLDIPYSEVKLLINSNLAKIFIKSTQHADAAGSTRPGATLWYDSVQGNCLAGFLRFKDNKLEVELRTTTGFSIQESEVLKWVRRLLLNKQLASFQLLKLTIESEVVKVD
jgi:hypothetical protein